ncbi:unnamed protein product, partial [Medioppia subpectinata]
YDSLNALPNTGSGNGPRVEWIEVKASKVCPFRGLIYSGETPTEIIKNVSGEVKSGQLLAIMGASGAGKTTLLNVLTARNLSKLRVKGVVLLNGQAVSAETM